MISHLPVEIPGTLTVEEPTSLLPDDIEAYCVKCKTARPMIAAQLVTTRNGRSAARGKCQVCGTTVMKFLPFS